MKDKACNMHKRLAMGDSIKGYAKGGSIGVNVSVPTNKPVTKPTGKMPMSPMEKARRNNGVKGM